MGKDIFFRGCRKSISAIQLVHEYVFYTDDQVPLLQKRFQVDEALKGIGKHIILMDIEMPLMDGMSAARTVRQQDSEVIIIFLTNLSQYAIQGYSVQAFDYILKPVTWFSFSAFLEKAMDRLRRKVVQYICVPTKEGIQKLAVQDISYIEIRSHTLFYHTADKTVCTTGRMLDVEARMAPYHFSRCNSGYLINLSHVESIQEGQVILSDATLPISRSRKKVFTESLVQYISSHLK